MRKILFQGYQNSWEFGGAAKINGEYFIINEKGQFKVQEGSVGQYIGVKDKNGREIFSNSLLIGPYTLLASGGPNDRFKMIHLTVSDYNGEYSKKSIIHTGRYRYYPQWDECEVVGTTFRDAGFIEAQKKIKVEELKTHKYPEYEV